MRPAAIAAARIEPTPEDFAIYQRHLVRILKECSAHDRTPADKVRIVGRWTLDYIGLTPRQENA